MTKTQQTLAFLRKTVSTLLELLGVAALVFGAWLINPIAGVLVAGPLLILVGVALDPPERAPRPPKTPSGGN